MDVKPGLVYFLNISVGNINNVGGKDYKIFVVIWYYGEDGCYEGNNHEPQQILHPVDFLWKGVGKAKIKKGESGKG